ncbi:MAG: MobQ family relaxase [Asticcacaulis sp.]
MAIYHASTKPIARSSGRSAVAAAAYRAGQELTDERTGLVHDYTRKGGVVSAEAVLADGSTVDRGDLWNAAEFAEKRKDSRTAREWIVALPAELDSQGRADLAREFGVELAKRYGVGVDIAVHMPDREGDNRNHHAHILTTTREVIRGDDGQLVMGAKTIIELSDSDRRKMGLGAAAEEVKIIRGLWEGLANGALERAGRSERIDGRSLEAQGVDREPTTHLGQMATDMERRGVVTDRGAGNRQVVVNNAERDQVRGQLIDLQAERDKRERARLKAMTSREIRDEIELIRPLPFEKAVERHPKMQAARQTKDGLAEELATTRANAQGLGREIEDWRKAHPIRAGLHDTGLFKAREVTERQALQKAAMERADVLNRANQAAGMVVLRLQPEIEALVFRNQAPINAKIGEMEKLAAQKHAQEMEAQRQQREITGTLEKFNSVATLRRLGASEYTDHSSRWKAMPEPIKQLVDDYNRMPEGDRVKVLDSLRERMTRDPEVLQKTQAMLAPERDRGRERDRGMER